MPSDTSQISRVRAAFSIAWAWRILGLPGRPAKHCKSPFRSENKASFSVYQAKSGERWFDHGTGVGGDVIDFWARAKGVSVKEALQSLRAMTLTEAPNSPIEAFSLPLEVKTAGSAIEWPEELKPPKSDECQQLGNLRGLSPEAFFLAGALGTLLMGTQRGQRLWVTTDARMRSAARRRLDGNLLDSIGKKSASPRGAPRDWIIGTQTNSIGLDQLKNILLVEGEGDYYAALQLAIEEEINFKVLAILGAAQRTFHPDCRPQFMRARVLIIAHNDPAGAQAAKTWATLFYSWAASTVTVQPLPFEHNDLNDVLRFSPEKSPHLLKGFHERTSPRTRRL